MTVQEQAEMGQQAFRAFERDLPQLWEERPGQWVAYQGDAVWASRSRSTSSITSRFEQGLTREEFVVFCIEPLETEIIFGVDAGD